MTDPDTVGSAILRGIRRLTIATAVLYLVVIGALVGVYIDSGNKADNLAKATGRTTTALCVFRGDVQSRAEQTAKFLKEHPEGFSGIPAAQLHQSLEAQRRTVKSLRSLDCPGPALP